MHEYLAQLQRIARSEGHEFGHRAHWNVLCGSKNYTHERIKTAAPNIRNKAMHRQADQQMRKPREQALGTMGPIRIQQHERRHNSSLMDRQDNGKPQNDTQASTDPRHVRRNSFGKAERSNHLKYNGGKRSSNQQRWQSQQLNDSSKAADTWSSVYCFSAVEALR